MKRVLYSACTIQQFAATCTIQILIYFLHLISGTIKFDSE